MEEVRPADDLLVWRDPDTGERHGTRITGGHCKAQWKADWALRWFALGVDYEMSGQGPDRQRAAVLAGVPHPGRRAAGGLHL